MLITRLAASVVALFLAAEATSQLPGPGLSWTGTSGGYAGSYLPSCVNLPVTAIQGESVTVRVSGDVGALFILFASGSGSQCLAFPGIGNALVLDLPVLTIATGVLTQITPCLSCPPGYQDLGFVIPQAIPRGASVSLQAASFGAGRPAFTVAVTGTVQ